MAYDADYYRTSLGSVPCEKGSPAFTAFNRGVAAGIVRSLAPASVVDVGCGLGFLVAALREFGVEAFGVDGSAYAISQVPDSVAAFCRVRSAVEPLELRVDLVTCVEVLEHLSPEEGAAAIAAMCAASDTVLFSSTPSDFDEPTHVNVQPEAYWVAAFAKEGFVPDPSVDVTFLTKHALLFRKSISHNIISEAA